MKKQILAISILTLALAATACGKKADETTAASTEAAAETTAESESETEEEEDVEEDYLTGTVTAVDGDILTVKSDDDESEKKYDLSKAEVTSEFPFSEGDLVDITFPAETTEDPVPVIALEVIESVIGQNTDPSVEGIVKDASEDSLTLEVDGEDYVLMTANAYIVAKDGITADKKATVTFIGDLDDEPMAVKVVMEDSYNTPDADINVFIGDVAQIGDDNIVLESGFGDFYTFVSDDIDFSQFAEGNTVEIQYEGSASSKEIPALKITKK